MNEGLTPSAAQREAIEADFGPTLVLAGPGAGKTFCLIERIRYLVDRRDLDPARICALTFTNKAAEEVAARLGRELGERADLISRSTIHSLCVRILRSHGSHLGLERGFGIADDEYQKEVLAKVGVPPKWRTGLLTRFGLARLGIRPLLEDDEVKFRRYRAYLAKRRMSDFDDLTHLTVELFERFPAVAREVASAWDYLLVDEAQDLNHVQYGIVRALAAEHRNLFVVGDDEQSIFSWTGANPRMIETFLNDFGVRRKVVLDENRRTAAGIFSLARRLISSNVPLFGEKRVVATRVSDHPIVAPSFPADGNELGWLLDDLRRDQAGSGLRWGEYAVLYRRHQIGDALEGALMQAGIPCRLAHGRSLADDPVVRYLIAALRVISFPGDPVVNEQFARQVLPHSLCDAIRKQAESAKLGFMPFLRRRARELAYTDEDGRKIRRALSAMQNLTALGERHDTIEALIEEILSQRVGPYRTILEERAEDLSDPLSSPEACRLAAALERVRDARGRVLIRPMGGLEIGLAGLLNGGGIRLVDYLGAAGAIPAQASPGPDDLVLDAEWSGPLGLAMTTFKALQLVNARSQDTFRDFVVVDLETTDRDIATAEIVEIAAVRVRNWKVVEEFQRLVKPRVPISPGAARTHRYTMADLADAPYFEAVRPEFEAFIGDDVLVAHNGYEFDFPILRRMSEERSFVTYDTLPLARWLRLGSARLEHLAERFGIDPGDSHKAIWDVRTLAQVFQRLEEEKVARARRVALSNVLDHLGVALALSDPDTLDPEGTLLKDITAFYALGRFTNCLDFYRAERERVGPSAATVEDVIDRLGGAARMEQIRREKRPDQRYPAAMARVRRLLAGIAEPDLEGQIREFLSRVALSKSDGIEADRERVNLLTLHSTKGLEFSRVYIVGVEDSEMPGSGPGGRAPSVDDLEESRRLLYVGMTRAKDRLVMTRVEAREGRPTGGHRFLDEMGIVPTPGGA